MDRFYSKHYIITDSLGRITSGWSDGPCQGRDTANAILLTDKGGYQFRLFPGGEENLPLFTADGVPMYRWDGEKVVRRSGEEIEADRAAIPAPTPSEAERPRADVDFLAALQGGDTVSVFELAKKYYPRLWGKSRLEALAEAGRLTAEELKELTQNEQ